MGDIGDINADRRLGVPAAGRPRVVRDRARDVRARLPDSLRLVVADADEPQLGGRRLRLYEPRYARAMCQRCERVAQAALRDLDRLRFLTIVRDWGFGIG